MKIQTKVEVVEVGHVAVDSGRIVIVDPVRELKYEDVVTELMDNRVDGQPPRTRQIVADKRDETNTFGEGAPMAVVSQAGLGDGVYPIYAEIVDCGALGRRVAKLIVDFELGPSNQLLADMLRQRADRNGNAG